MNSEKVLARAIARLRKEHGLTQAALAERADVSITFVAALEHATRTPSLKTIDALCSAFGVSPGALFAAGEPPVTPRSKRMTALHRALESLPSEAEAPLLELVRTIARVSAPERSGAKRKATKARAPTRRRPKGA